MGSGDSSSQNIPGEVLKKSLGFWADKYASFFDGAGEPNSSDMSACSEFMLARMAKCMEEGDPEPIAKLRTRELLPPLVRKVLDRNFLLAMENAAKKGWLRAVLHANNAAGRLSRPLRKKVDSLIKLAVSVCVEEAQVGAIAYSMENAPREFRGRMASALCRAMKNAAKGGDIDAFVRLMESGIKLPSGARRRFPGYFKRAVKEAGKRGYVTALAPLLAYENLPRGVKKQLPVSLIRAMGVFARDHGRSSPIRDVVERGDAPPEVVRAGKAHLERLRKLGEASPASVHGGGISLSSHPPLSRAKCFFLRLRPWRRPKPHSEQPWREKFLKRK